MLVEKYQKEKEKLWDQFVKNCKNSHFFFFRKYLEYHEDRFEDFSLIIYDEKKKIIGLLPANKNQDQVISHGGLTFGGLLMDEKSSTSKVLEIFQTILNFLKKSGTKEFIYKPSPFIYSKKTAQEDLYALFRNNASLYRRDVCSVIDYASPVQYSKGRKWSVKKALLNENILIEENQSLDIFWKLLNEVLRERHGVKPVHSLDEIKLLKELFPNNISVITGKLNGEILSGAVIFETETVAHVQYMATNYEGKENFVLDKVINHAIKSYNNKRYFSFGISNEEGGWVLNEGLISQKEGYGAKSIVHDFYKIDLR